MAASVASLLTEAIQKSDLFSKLASHPAVKTAGAAAAGAGKVTQGVSGQLKPGAGPGALAGGMAGKAMTGMAGMMGDIMPKLGKLASPTQLLGLPKKLLSKSMGLMGINLSISTLLRQSQLFTGILGALFQILGGFVDVILAPFMPFFVNIIRKLASQIPVVREWAAKIYGWLDTYVFPLIRKGFDWIWGKVGDLVNWFQDNMPEIKDTIMGVWKDSIKPALDEGWEIIKGVIAWGKENIWPTITAAWDLWKGMFNTFWAFIKDDAWPILKNIVGNLVTIFDSLKWLRDDIYPLIQNVWDWVIKEVGGFILWLTDNIVERLTKIIPLIESIITQVVDTLINGIIKPLWAALEPILKWYVDMVMTQWEWIIGVFEDKILPFVRDVIDDLMPHIQSLSEAFMQHVAPHIAAFFEAVRDFVDAFLDVALPIIKWMLRILWKVLEPILKLVFKLVGFVFWIMKWVLKGLTWILRLPFTWRQQILDPLLSAGDKAFDILKKAWFWLQNGPQKIKSIILTSLAQFLQRMGTSGGIRLGSIFGKEVKIPMGWLVGLGNKVMDVANEATNKFYAAQTKLDANLSTSTGGMRAKYGTSVTEININNFSERRVLDSTRRMVIDGDNQRDIENSIELEADLGAYSSLGSGITI